MFLPQFSVQRPTVHTGLVVHYSEPERGEGSTPVKHSCVFNVRTCSRARVVLGTCEACPHLELKILVYISRNAALTRGCIRLISRRRGATANARAVVLRFYENFGSPRAVPPPPIDRTAPILNVAQNILLSATRWENHLILWYMKNIFSLLTFFRASKDQ